MDMNRVPEKLRPNFKKILDMADTEKSTVYFIDGCEGGLVGYTKKSGHTVPVYDYEMCARYLADQYMQDDDYKNMVSDGDYDIDSAMTDAYEWLDHNTVPSLPYLYDDAPVMIYAVDDEDDDEDDDSESTVKRSDIVFFETTYVERDYV